MSAVALRGVLDQIRTTLVELIAEMRAGMPETADKPSAAVADHAVNVVVHGHEARVSVNAAQASGGGTHQVTATPSASPSRSPWRRVGALTVGIATIIGALIALAQWQGWGL